MTSPVDGIENEQMQVLWKLFGAAPMSVGQKGLNFRLILARFSPSLQELSLPVWPNNCSKSVSSISIHLNGSLQSAPVRMYSYVSKAVNGKQAFCLHKPLPGLVNTSAEKSIRRVRIYKMKKLWSQFFSKWSEDHCNIQRYETYKSPNAHFQLVILLFLPN